MKNQEKVEKLLADLKRLSETSAEKIAIDELEYKLNGNSKVKPRVIVIDENLQYFNGRIYNRDKRTGKYTLTIDEKFHYLHIDVWTFYNGEPPEGYDIHHNTRKEDGTFDVNRNNIEDLLLLTKSEHSTLHLKNRPFIEYHCINCGSSFKSKAPNAKYCCLHCRNEYHRHSDNNLVERECIVCSKKFMTNQNRPTLTCTKECRYKLIWQRIRGDNA